ncbi:MAG TPA: phosphoribosylpyrophosphate synthetase, partial [Alphaproteobacteria bacterium]|nr:phosphoribosylpyrophosphate synthetase [Alphaproteobacteria bacterium]
VYSYVVHGVLSGKAVERVENSAIKKLVTTDSIMATDEVLKSSKFEQLTIAPLMGEAILRIAEDRSISALFK